MQAGTWCVRWAAEQIRTMPVRSGQLEIASADDSAPEGCAACEVHKEMAEAERLLAGVLRNWGAEPAPPERRATVLLVRSDLRAAQAKFTATPCPTPELMALREQAQERMLAAESVLPDRQSEDRAEWERAHTALHSCWEAADDFAGAWFRPQGSEADLEAVIERMTPEQRRELAQILAGS